MEPSVWNTSLDGEIVYKQLSAKELEDTITMMENSFLTHENVCTAIGVPDDPEAMKELRQLLLAVAKEGITVIAVDNINNKIAGACFNRYVVQNTVDGELSEFEAFAKSCKQLRSQAVMQFLSDMDCVCDLFKICNVDCLLEIMFLGVSPQYRRRGIAKTLIEVSIKLGEQMAKDINVRLPLDGKSLYLPARPKIASSLFTSLATQKIGKQLGFQIAAEISMEELKFQGRTYRSVIGLEPPTMTIEYKNLI